MRYFSIAGGSANPKVSFANGHKTSAPRTPDPNADPPPGLRRSVDYGTAIVVSDRVYLLAAAPVVDQCQSITVSGFGHAERVAVDSTSDLALLRLYGAQNLIPAGFASDSVPTDNLALVGIADPLTQPGDAAVTATMVRRKMRSEHEDFHAPPSGKRRVATASLKARKLLTQALRAAASGRHGLAMASRTAIAA